MPAFPFTPLPRATALRHGLAATLLALACGAGLAAPFIPASDSEIVERLPLGATDPSIRRVDSLRKQLAARPGDAALRLDIARRYFDLATAQGDPRYVGYAAAAIAPLADSAAQNSGYWLLLGMVQQYSHDFPRALTSLDRASAIAPTAVEPMAWRAAIYMVQARYAEAQAECQRMAPHVHAVLATGCSAYVQASTGGLAAAYAALGQVLNATPPPPPELRLWALTRMAEMAQRLQRPAEAEGHFRQALQLGITDQFLLAAYADFLLQQQRPAEVLVLLGNWERSDVLLLRLVLAAQATGDRRAADWTRQMAERFATGGKPGERLHEQEAARFALDVEHDAKRALATAVLNYATQKEPRDADILLRSAWAAGQPEAARPALEWLRSSGFEDPRLAALARQWAGAATVAPAAAGGAR